MKGLAPVINLFLLVALPVSTDVTVTFLDVAKGDAIWISDDTGHEALIDGCGGDT